MFSAAQGAVQGSVVRHTRKSAEIPETTYNELATEANASHGSPWQDAILDSIQRRDIIGTPIACKSASTTPHPYEAWSCDSGR